MSGVPGSIDVARSQQYTTNVELLLQQKQSKFTTSVTTDNYTGKGAKAVEQIGETEAEERQSRHDDTPLMDTPHDARWVHPRFFRWADLIDDEDKVQSIVDMTSPYAMGAAAAMNRARDKVIIGAFFGTAYVGEDGTLTEAFDAANFEVAVDTGAGSATGLNVPKLRAAKKKLLAAENDLDMDEAYVAVNAEQHDNLLAETQTTSLDYTDKPVLVEGKITRFMGFNFIHSEKLTVDANGYRQNPCWVRSGMHLGLWTDTVGRVSEREDKNYATQVYFRQYIGATRLQQGKVVRILNSEA